MDGLEGALHSEGGVQFAQRQVGLFAEQGAQLAAMRADQLRLAPGKAMPRCEVAGAPPLVQELGHQA